MKKVILRTMERINYEIIKYNHHKNIIWERKLAKRYFYLLNVLAEYFQIMYKCIKIET